MGLTRLRQNIVKHVAVNISQSEVSTSVAIRQVFVINPQSVKHCGVQVMNTGRLVDGLEADFIGGAVNGTAFDAADQCS